MVAVLVASSANIVEMHTRIGVVYSYLADWGFHPTLPQS